MSTLPIHTVQHVKSAFTKFQIIAMLFTAVTLIAAFLAAISGVQLSKLQKLQAADIKAPQPAVAQPAPVKTTEQWEKEIKVLENRLAAEKAAARDLTDKIRALESKIERLEAAPAQQAKPVQSQPPPPPAPAEAPSPSPKPPAEGTSGTGTPKQPPSGMQQPQTNAVEPPNPAETAPPAVTKPSMQPAPAGEQKAAPNAEAKP